MIRPHKSDRTIDYYCPSREEIRQACEAIQATWSEEERIRRMCVSAVQHSATCHRGWRMK